MAKFEKGWAGGPGRPKGSRQKLADSFLSALANDFNEHGVAVIEHVRVNDPSTYVRTIAALLPKEITAEGDEPLFQNVTITFVNPEAAIR